MDITGEHDCVGVFFHQDALVSPLKKMACPLVPPVVMRGICDVEMPHELTQVSERGLEKEMEVIVHEHIAVKSNRVGFQRLIKNLYEPMPVSVIMKDRFPVVPAAYDMICRTCILYP